MTTKLTRQFNTDNPAALRRDLFRLCDELGKAIASIEQRLTALEGAPAITVPSRSLCIVETTNVSVTTTEFAVPFSAADVLDTDGYHDPSVNNTRLTAPADGHYDVWGTLFDDSASNNYDLRLREGGANFLASGGRNGTINDGGVLVHWEGQLTAGQYFELMLDCNISTTVSLVQFSMRRLDR